jgi:hypothetical protein
MPEALTLSAVISGVSASYGQGGVARFLDTDGTDLEQFPWFTPTQSSDYPYIEGWYVQLMHNGLSPQSTHSGFLLVHGDSKGNRTVQIAVDKKGLTVENKTYPSLHAFVEEWAKKSKSSYLRFPLAPVVNK